MLDEFTTLRDVRHDQDDARSLESDETLVARAGVEDFVVLYRRYLDAVYRYLYVRMEGNRHEAEDVTSVVFERMLSSLRSYKPTGSFKGWLFTIVSRSLIDHYRSKGNTRRSQTDPSEDTIADPSLGPEENAILADQLRNTFAAIANLGEEQREIISLRFIADLTYSEIAAIVRKREAAVKMMAYRALEEIRRRHRDGEF